MKSGLLGVLLRRGGSPEMEECEPTLVGNIKLKRQLERLHIERSTIPDETIASFQPH
jgi:hypothetical protein